MLKIPELNSDVFFDPVGLPFSQGVYNPVPEGLLAWWRFQGNPNDSSGNNYELTLVGATYGDDINGNANSALSLDGVNDYADAGNVLNFDYNEPFSISIWVNTPDVSSYQHLIVKRDSPGNLPGYQFAIKQDAELAFQLSDGNGRISVHSDGVLSVDTWYHLVVTYDGSADAGGVSMYINTAIQTNDVIVNNLTTTTTNTNAFQIGIRDSTDSPFQGRIDNVRIYNRELSADEVSLIYNSEL